MLRSLVMVVVGPVRMAFDIRRMSDHWRTRSVAIACGSFRLWGSSHNRKIKGQRLARQGGRENSREPLAHIAMSPMLANLAKMVPRTVFSHPNVAIVLFDPAFHRALPTLTAPCSLSSVCGCIYSLVFSCASPFLS
ncbi:hypothetical protein CPB86DRAFT_31989 [Serendipita vermifera]|nr:hypothetical protein CPB86DRAFT_31989 [Serendipita vermifera]